MEKKIYQNSFVLSEYYHLSNSRLRSGSHRQLSGRPRVCPGYRPGEARGCAGAGAPGRDRRPMPKAAEATGPIRDHGAVSVASAATLRIRGRTGTWRHARRGGPPCRDLNGKESPSMDLDAQIERRRFGRRALLAAAGGPRWAPWARAAWRKRPPPRRSPTPTSSTSRSISSTSRPSSTCAPPSAGPRRGDVGGTGTPGGVDGRAQVPFQTTRVPRVRRGDRRRRGEPRPVPALGAGRRRGGPAGDRPRPGVHHGRARRRADRARAEFDAFANETTSCSPPSSSRMSASPPTRAPPG